MVLSDMLIMGLARDDLRAEAYRRAEWLTRNGVDVNSASAGGTPPLFRAIAGNDPILVEQLLRLGADPAVGAVVGSPNDPEMNAVEYAKLTKEVIPERDMTDVFEPLDVDPVAD